MPTRESWRHWLDAGEYPYPTRLHYTVTTRPHCRRFKAGEVYDLQINVNWSELAVKALDLNADRSAGCEFDSRISGPSLKVVLYGHCNESTTYTPLWKFVDHVY